MRKCSVLCFVYCCGFVERMCLSGLRGYFITGESRVNKVATGSWFQDQSEFVGVGLGRNVYFLKYFSEYVNRQRNGPMTVESEKN